MKSKAQAIHPPHEKERRFIVKAHIEAILLSLTAIIGYIAMSTMVYVITKDAVLSALIANVVAAIIVLGIRTKMRNHPFVQARRVSWTEITMAPFMIVIVNLTMTIAALWVKQHTASTTLNEQALSDTPVILLLLLGLVFAPLGEEALMRGLVYPVMRSKFSTPMTIATTSVMFSMMHGNLTQIVLTIPLGIVLGYLYERTHRLSLCVAAHSLFNFTAMLLPSKPVESAAVPIMATFATAALIIVWVLATEQMNSKMNNQS